MDSIGQADSIYWEKTLGEVVVKVERIRNKMNGYVANLQGDNIVKGKNAEDVLKFLPRVEYLDGGFKIDGQAVTKIYLNGIRLDDLSQLQNIMGENLTTVEVEYIGGVNQKSAEMGGVIRINMKKPQNGGYYGNVSAHHSSTPSDLWGSNGLGGMAYWGNKKWGLYANGNLGRGSYVDKGTDQVGQSADDIQSLTATWQKNKSLYASGNLQMMYQPNARHTLTTKIYASRNISDGNTRLANLLTPTPSIDNNHWDGNTTQADFLAQYTCKIDSMGGLLTASAEYYHAYSNNGNVFDTFLYGSNIENTYNIGKIKIDLSQPLNRYLQLQVGGSFDYDGLAYRDKTLAARRHASVRGDADIRISAPLLYITLSDSTTDGCTLWAQTFNHTLSTITI